MPVAVSLGRRAGGAGRIRYSRSAGPFAASGSVGGTKSSRNLNVRWGRSIRSMSVRPRPGATAVAGVAERRRVSATALASMPPRPGSSARMAGGCLDHDHAPTFGAGQDLPDRRAVTDSETGLARRARNRKWFHQTCSAWPREKSNRSQRSCDAAWSTTHQPRQPIVPFDSRRLKCGRQSVTAAFDPVTCRNQQNLPIRIRRIRSQNPHQFLVRIGGPVTVVTGLARITSAVRISPSGLFSAWKSVIC